MSSLGPLTPILKLLFTSTRQRFRSHKLHTSKSSQNPMLLGGQKLPAVSSNVQRTDSIWLKKQRIKNHIKAHLPDIYKQTSSAPDSPSGCLLHSLVIYSQLEAYSLSITKQHISFLWKTNQGNVDSTNPNAKLLKPGCQAMMFMFIMAQQSNFKNLKEHLHRLQLLNVFAYVYLFQYAHFLYQPVQP